MDLNPKALWRGLRVSLLDGSTVRLRPHGDIAQKVPTPPQPSQSSRLLVPAARGRGLLRPHRRRARLRPGIPGPE